MLPLRRDKSTDAYWSVGPSPCVSLLWRTTTPAVLASHLDVDCKSLAVVGERDRALAVVAAVDNAGEACCFKDSPLALVAGMDHGISSGHHLNRDFVGEAIYHYLDFQDEESFSSPQRAREPGIVIPITHRYRDSG